MAIRKHSSTRMRGRKGLTRKGHTAVLHPIQKIALLSPRMQHAFVKYVGHAIRKMTGDVSMIGFPDPLRKQRKQIVNFLRFGESTDSIRIKALRDLLKLDRDGFIQRARILASRTTELQFLAREVDDWHMDADTTTWLPTNLPAGLPFSRPNTMRH